MVMSVLRFALQDGPGIRTTVFLKGCTLDCLWCHNPESKSEHRELAYFADRCTQCGACVEACPNKAHSIVNGVHKIDRSLCNISGSCVDACAYDALEITGEMVSAEEVMEMVVKDKAYYDESGGGLTISGGEPMMQFEFTKKLLQLAKEYQIHTCLDTSGYATGEHYLEILPLTDRFLFDLKASDPGVHKKLTGVSNELILENLQLLYDHDAELELRLPVVSKVNDHDAHLANMKEIKKKYPKLSGITVMPYHNIGQSKCERYGYKDPMAGLPGADDELIRSWNASLGNEQE